MADQLLVVKNLKKHFPIRGGVFSRIKGYVYAVDGISFSLEKGQTIGLVGESGCGKSTLGRTILRLYEPTGGQVYLNGSDLSKLNRRQLRSRRRDMQIVFQDPYSSLNPRMTVQSILTEPFIIHNIGSAKERSLKVSHLLELVGLPEEAKELHPHEFSGGQRQRIGIARAIALNPQLVVADEPVSALDVSVQSQILNLMSELRKKLSLSYVFIAHDLAVIEHISDFVAVMYLGRIVEFAAADVLYSNPSHPYTKALIEAIPTPEYKGDRRSIRKSGLDGDVPSPISPPSGCHFHPRCPMATSICREQAPHTKNISTSGKTSHLVSCHLL